MTCDAWPVRWTHPIDDIDPDIIAAASQTAQTILWSKTGRRLGVCTVTETYRMPGAGECGLPVPLFDPATRTWVDAYRTGGECCWITLAEQPVVSVTSVAVEGVALTEDQWQLSGNRLGRVGACWAWVEACAVDPIEVTYRHGIPLADDGMEALAMGEVAWEVVQFISDQPCRLPWLATSVTRNGVSVTLADPADLEKINRLGLPISDALIGAANPYGRHARSRVVSPDVAMPMGQWR